ncbi:Butyrate kinase 2 [Koleobacter methoxysyntrophicus]|uniref:Probable butyrate kinase n=1 Tax=Koleobacter methoxysyntrophicus TaxID=2751313 RepID=A0A8A0RT93_9FIRM|nr:butyrate kinase [Koleobacter methoxysyntrophicus]QSQ10366.1 Butyrate kinase 2 [Koleobacter methoxysyntrophicus]
MKNYRILAVNPGSTSTKIAVFDNSECILKETIEHNAAELNKFSRVADQYEYRLKVITDSLVKKGIPMETLDAVIGRGGLLKPMESGTYRVNEKMVEDLKEGLQGEHPSNLGGIIAFNLGQDYQIPSYIVDPVAVDEMEDIARISGLKELSRRSLSHALNIKAVGRKVAKDAGRSYFDCNFIIVHLGGGISVTAHRKGRMIDVNNANSEGPFSPERTGTLPVSELVQLCYSGKYTYDEMKRKITREGGVYSYLGTKDMREVEKRIEKGDREAELILEAMVYQIAKEIGAMATTLKGDVDKIILTGGIAHSRTVTAKIIERVEFIAPVVVVPGEEELESLALGALRVLMGEEEEKTYS